MNSRSAIESFKTELRIGVSKTLKSSADASRELIKQADALYKQASSALDAAQTFKVSKTLKVLKDLDAARQAAVEQLKLVRYFHKQAVWLTTHFPEGKFRDVPGLCKLVDRQELKANDWSLTPGRYVGVAPEEVDADANKAKELNIELLYLPPYSPNLNLIERLWRFVKKQVLYSKHYDRFDTFRNSIDTCISELGTRFKNEMQSLMTMKFQLF